MKNIRIMTVILAALVFMLPGTPGLAQSNYSLAPIVLLGDPAPGGGVFFQDFEPWAFNNAGSGVFASDLPTGGEGLYLLGKGNLSQIIRAGQDAPGGGTFSFDLGRTGLNGGGDVSFAFTLTPGTFDFPIGINSGVYRFSKNTGTITPVLVPGVTPAPGGGIFAGTYFNTSLNNGGNMVFSGMVPATIGPGASIGLGMGLFKADKKNRITSVVSPGDPAPGGGIFDFAINGFVNDGGDIAFGGHVAGEACITLGQVLPGVIFCAESVYYKNASTGEIQSIAHQGDAAPGGGIYQYAFGPVINNRGDIVFIGDLTSPPTFGEKLGVFLYSHGVTIAVARPGDPMPGGGNFVTGPLQVGNYYLNNRGDVSFSATLDTDDNNDGYADTGLYVFSRGFIKVVARTGTVIPGVGTIALLQPPIFAGSPWPLPFATLNDRGQVFFQATLSDGRGVLLIATPTP